MNGTGGTLVDGTLKCATLPGPRQVQWRQGGETGVEDPVDSASGPARLARHTTRRVLLDRVPFGREAQTTSPPGGKEEPLHHKFGSGPRNLSAEAGALPHRQFSASQLFGSKPKLPWVLVEGSRLLRHLCGHH